MSVFSKLSIASLLVAAQGVVADDTFGTKVVLNKEKSGFTGLDWKEVTPGSVLTLVKKEADGKENKLETVTAQPRKATEWTLDGKIVKAVGFKEATKEDKKPKRNMELKLKRQGDNENADEKMTLVLDDKKKLQEEDAKKFTLTDGDFDKILTGDLQKMTLTDNTNYTVEEIVPAKPEKEAKAASYTVTSIEDIDISVSFEKNKDGEWSAVAGDYKFESSADDFAKLVAEPPTATEIEATLKSDSSKKLQYTVSAVAAAPATGEEDKKRVLTMKVTAAASIAAALKFEEKDGQFACVTDGAHKDMVLAVVERAKMTFKNGAGKEYPSPTELKTHMLTEADKDGQQWYLSIAKSREDNESWWKSAMNWVYISLAIVAVAVICFFVFGGKKDTESDDESDLDTSDDEEEDAAATEAKEEEA